MAQCLLNRERAGNFAVGKDREARRAIRLMFKDLRRAGAEDGGPPWIYSVYPIASVPNTDSKVSMHYNHKVAQLHFTSLAVSLPSTDHGSAATAVSPTPYVGQSYVEPSLIYLLYRDYQD
jgi:hypothetical protein